MILVCPRTALRAGGSNPALILLCFPDPSTLCSITHWHQPQPKAKTLLSSSSLHKAPAHMGCASHEMGASVPMTNFSLPERASAPPRCLWGGNGIGMDQDGSGTTSQVNVRGSAAAFIPIILILLPQPQWMEAPSHPHPRYRTIIISILPGDLGSPPAPTPLLFHCC